MRTEQEMYDLILKVANEDQRVRAVAINGSRANKNAPKDIFQDYDIVYLVNDMASFLEEPNWVDVFGDRKSTRLNSSHVAISYAVFCLKKKKCHTRLVPGPTTANGTVPRAATRRAATVT